ncbi:MAG: HEAT repeat domain-containing protein [Elusimicrobia bacterium]|nr:HEAT repeat domain-containing protein [Elusimicrobiota bacterium]
MNKILNRLPVSAAFFLFPISYLSAAGNLKIETLSVNVSGGPKTAETALAGALRQDKSADYRCARIEALGASKDDFVARELAIIVNDPDEDVKRCATRTAGLQKNIHAAEALLANFEDYHRKIRKGAYENNLGARLSAIDSIWSLGEIGDPITLKKLWRLYSESDEVVKLNMAVSAGKAKSKDGKQFLYNIAGSAQDSSAVRAAAYELLAGLKAPMPAVGRVFSAGMEKGDIIYTGGWLGIPQSWIKDLPVGHVGLFGGADVRNGRIVVTIYDCQPNEFKPAGGVRKIFSWSDFTQQHKYPFYGNRTTSVHPTQVQRELIIKAAISKLGRRYNNTHIGPKGPDTFDCVGYAEYAYEAAGLNPTPDDQETGLGWPLTPAEQFAATVPNQSAPMAYISAARIGSSSATLKKVYGSGVFGGPYSNIPELPPKIVPSETGY